MLSGVMKQVESGNETWGVTDDQKVWVLRDDTWQMLGPDKMNYISVGKAGVWALDALNDVFVRKGKLQDSLGLGHELRQRGVAPPPTGCELVLLVRSKIVYNFSLVNFIYKKKPSTAILIIKVFLLY
jgi:hypothetical protein